MEPEHHIANENLRIHNAHACYRQEKWPIKCMAVQVKERSISATEQFQSTWQRFHDEQKPQR